MNPKVIFTVFRKEALDIIRDRRTLIFMIIVPLLLIPGLMFFLSRFMISSAQGIAEADSTVAVVGAADDSTLVRYLRQERKAKPELSGAGELDAFATEAAAQENAFINVRTDLAGVEDALAAMRARDVEAVLIVPAGFAEQIDSGQATRVEIKYYSTNEWSEKAYDRLVASLRFWREQVVAARLDSIGQPQDLVRPFDIQGADVAEAQERAGEIFGRILPYLIILMTFGGSTFPAISMAAGEKEQKTLETLLASPARRTELVTGKFLVIALAGVISAVLSLVGLYYGFSMGEMGRRLGEMLTLHLDLPSILMAVALVVPLAIVFAGLLLTISVFARSYREAQGYMGLLNFLVILPAFASFLPGVELDATLAAVPVVNVSLVLKEILSGKLASVLPYYGITIVSTLVVAAVAVLLCAWMFKREQAIFKV